MTKDNEAIREDTPVVLDTKKKVAKCSCSEDIGRDIRCVQHGDLAK